VPADADLIIMSKATTPQLRDMTARAIYTARAGAAPHTLDVYVMEQMQIEYPEAVTIYAPGAFNYNAFANHAAKQGNSEWIVFANNDLTFEPGWLEHLLAAHHSVTSPHSPGYHRHHAVWQPREQGYEVGRHLAGWCFMMKRSLWDSLGGLDETYPFYCADNAVMDQLRRKGIQPMLVRDAIVRHGVSATLSREPSEVQDELTWASVHEYNEANPNTKTCEKHPGYLAWKRKHEIR
jgi:hypothetical protein